MWVGGEVVETRQILRRGSRMFRDCNCVNFIGGKGGICSKAPIFLLSRFVLASHILFYFVCHVGQFFFSASLVLC